MSFKRFGILGLVVAGALAVPAGASAQEPAAAVAIASSIGHLGPEGVSATVPVTYSCVTPPDFSAQLSVEVKQWNGTKHADGTGIVQTGMSPGDLVCDGLSHSTTVEVPDNGNFPFKQGKAAVQASLMVYSYLDGFITVTTGDQPLTLKKK